MTDDIKREIERLLDEPSGTSATEQKTSRLRARLAATLAEGLGSADGTTKSEASDPASIAAFIDGRLSPEERQQFLTALARRQDLRADVESAAELVHSIAEGPVQAPRGLLTRATAQLTPVAPPRRTAQPSRWQVSSLWPKRPVAWAVVAALMVVALTPAGLMVASRLGGSGGEPELSSAPTPGSSDSTNAAQPSCDDKTKKEPSGDNAKAPPPAPEQNQASPTAPVRKDPCDKAKDSGK
jgi:hypothetical protein